MPCGIHCLLEWSAVAQEDEGSPVAHSRKTHNHRSRGDSPWSGADSPDRPSQNSVLYQVKYADLGAELAVNVCLRDFKHGVFYDGALPV